MQATNTLADTDLFHLDQLHTDLFLAGSAFELPDRRRRCPVIALVHVTRNNVKIKHGYCLSLCNIDLFTKRQAQTCLCLPVSSICLPVFAFLSTVTFCTKARTMSWCNDKEICNDKFLILHYYHILLLGQKWAIITWKPNIY